MDLSLVIPLYNEVESVRPLQIAIRDALGSKRWQYETVFVDDGSNDGTLAEVYELASNDPTLRVIELGKNFGQTTALLAGIEAARGAVIVTLDGDLQNDPKDIPRMVEKVESGYDVVIGWRRNRQDPIISRKLPSRIANWVIGRVLQVPIHDTGCALKAFRAELIERVPLYSDLHRFIPAMCSLASDRLAEVEVNHHPRHFGESKYGLSRIGRVIVDVMEIKMLLSCARRPLRWFGGWSIPFFLLALAIGIRWLVALATESGYSGFVLPVTAFLLGYTGVHLLFAGIFGELVVCADPSEAIDPLATRIDVGT